MDNLDRDLIRMRMLGYGTNYGKYKQDFPNTKIEEEELPDPEPNRTCVYCGVGFYTDHRARKYCSEECYRKEANRRYWNSAQRRKRAYITKCAECGSEFNSVDQRIKYCSVSCRRAAARKQEKTRRDKRKES